jgi:histidinol-phosphate aminotransferase
VKLASNENPLGPSPAAVAGAHAALASVHRYPDGPGVALRQALARRHKLEPNQVVVGNGSTDLIDLLARAYLAPGDNAVIAEQAFARFRQCVNARNGGARLVPMREHTHDLEAMAAAVDPRTRLIFVANPNNPTGTWNTRAELDALLDQLSGDVLVVLDEAYFEYAADRADYPSGLDYVKAGAPVVVLRTFSKVYGLAGLRVGYALGPPEVTLALDTVREPFNTNLVGQAAALGALEDHGHVVRSLELNRVEKARLEQAFAARGLRVLPSLANFLCVEVGDGAAVFQKLLAKGVIVRPLRPYGLESWLRVSVGTADENDTLLEAIDAVLLPARP